MVRFAWPGWWLGLLVGIGPPAAAQQAAAKDPPSFELKENYPNPLFATTTIPFTLHAEACRNGHRPIVSLEIRNVIAQVVAVPLLIEEPARRVQSLRLQCGEYRAFWDGRLATARRRPGHTGTG
jgi:hypothetical protein